ncbi:MAG: hypothetical protein AB7O86_05905 [Porticoccaceae bacterium]
MGHTPERLQAIRLHSLKLQQQMKADMTEVVREIVGPGYVGGYYEQMADDFVTIAIAYANSEVEHAIATRIDELADEAVASIVREVVEATR